MRADKFYYYFIIVLFLICIPLQINFLNQYNDIYLTNDATEEENKQMPISSAIETELEVLWNKTYGNVNGDGAKSITNCSSGGYIITGWTNTTGTDDIDIFLLRIAEDGTQIWNRTYGSVEEDKGFQVIECSNGSGGFAIVATYYNTSAPTKMDWNNTDLMVIRVAPNGNLLWNKTYSGPEQTFSSCISDIGRSIVECPNGDLALAGVTLTSGGSGDVWLLRIASDGRKLWSYTFHNRITDRCYSPHSLVLCQDNGFAIASYTYNSTHTNDVWIIRTDRFGIHIWNSTFHIPDYQRPESLIALNTGGFLIMANNGSGSAGDAWLIRIDTSGNHIWNRTYGGVEEDRGYSVVQTEDSGFTFVGTTHSYDINNGDVWLVHTGAGGDLLWHYSIDYDLSGNSASSVVYKGLGIYTIAGSTLRFGDQTADIWVVKLHVKPKITTTTTSSSNGGSGGNSGENEESSIPYGQYFLIFSLIGIFLLIVNEKRKIRKK